MSAHLEQSSDLGTTAQHFYETKLADAPRASPPPMTLSQLNHWLDELAAPSAPAASLVADAVARTTPAQLKIVVRLVRKDLRMCAFGARTRDRPCSGCCR
jgi:DNA ligase-3